jgi:outer membrane protein assembly factor BamB
MTNSIREIVERTPRSAAGALVGPLAFLLLLVTIPTLCLAGDTRSWIQSDYRDFEKGNLKNLSIRSDGRLSLAPKTTEVYDSSTSYLWALARDSRGNLYTAGGPGAKLFRIAPNGKAEKIAEFDALEIHAIAIDSHDRIYAATSPDGRIYRVDANGKSSQFYDPKQKYIWSMLCDAADNLYIATGDQGEVHRVTPSGKGEVFFKSDETHARSLAFDRDGDLIVGTEPGGLVIRVSPKGEGFVLYQMPKREVTALAIGPGNEIYAAAVGSKTAALPIAPLPPARPAGVIGLPGAPAPAPAAAPLTIPGGSDVYRITTQRSPERLWTGAQDIVYALALDPDGHLLIGSGNKGDLYRVETRTLYSTLVSFPVAEVTALLTAKDGSLYAATGNVGKVYRVGPGLEHEGSIESDVFDTGGFSVWGRLSGAGDLHGGKFSLAARSGNLDRPQQNWSAWSQPIEGFDGGRLTVPSARFIQFRATLTAPAGDTASPTLDSVEAAYLRQNVPPKIDQIEIAPPNYKFPAPVETLTLSSPLTLSLPALGSAPPARANLDVNSPTITPSLTYSKGAQGVRWSASDDNGDALIFTVEIRGEKETAWKLLKDKVHEKYFSFDSNAFPDGDYRIRITASDAPSNTPENALETQEESDPFTIDNSPPHITNLRAAGNVIEWHAADDLSTIRRAEYSVDGGDWTVVDPVTRLSDSQALDYKLTLTNLKPGEHTVAVRSTDDFENTAVGKIVLR